MRPIERADIEPPQRFVVDGVVWHRYDPRALPAIGGIYDVWTSQGRFLIEAYRGAAREQLLLESEDAETWSLLGRITTEPALAEAVIETQFGYFAGGRADTQDDAVGLWRSGDGQDWEQIADTLAMPCGRIGGRGYIGAFDMTKSGLIARGAGDLGDWVTADGIAWRCLATIPNIGVVSGHGISVGSGEEHMWYSSDGLTWEIAGDIVGSRSELAIVQDGFLALARRGGPGDQVVSVSTSTDGRQWIAQDNPFGDRSIPWISSSGNRVIALEEGNYERGAGAVWVSSPSATTWSRYRLPRRKGDAAYGVALLGSRVVVIGTLYQDSTDDAMVVWVADIP